MNAVHTTVEDWLHVVRGEYSEIPGLQLTKPQIQRMWGLDPVTCETLLETLVRAHFLRRTDTGAYARFDLDR